MTTPQIIETAKRYGLGTPFTKTTQGCKTIITMTCFCKEIAGRNVVWMAKPNGTWIVFTTASAGTLNAQKFFKRYGKYTKKIVSHSGKTLEDYYCPSTGVNMPNKRSKVDYTLVDEMLNANATIKTICEQTGVSHVSVWKRRKKLLDSGELL